MSAKLFVEGAAHGPNSKLLQSRCREGFRKLLEKCGFSGRMPQIVACGSRGAAYDDFCAAHANAIGTTFVALLVDSEDPVSNIEQTWAHLKVRDNWDRPIGATDEQVLLMTTCMETWIVTDRTALQKHYGSRLQVNTLPALQDLEVRDRHSIQTDLQRATRECKNAFEKGKRSFAILRELDPGELRKYLSHFTRCERVLSDKL